MTDARDDQDRSHPAQGCPNAQHMGQHACANRHQCWEPCGELGHSEEHARPGTDPATAAAIRASLGVDPALEIPLPCDVKVGGATFRKGVSLATFVMAARRWHREAFPEGYNLTPEQKAENLAILQGKAPAPAMGDLQRELDEAIDEVTDWLEYEGYSEASIRPSLQRLNGARLRLIVAERRKAAATASNDETLQRTPNEQRLAKIQQQLIERGCTTVGMTWAEGAESLDREARAGALADFMEAWLQGKSTPVYFLRDDLLTGEQLVERVRLLEGQIKSVAEGIERSEEGLLAYLEGQKFHRSASHVPPDYRDAHNRVLDVVIERVQSERKMRGLAAEVRDFPQGSGGQTR